MDEVGGESRDWDDHLAIHVGEEELAEPFIYADDLESFPAT